MTDKMRLAELVQFIDIRRGSPAQLRWAGALLHEGPIDDPGFARALSDAIYMGAYTLGQPRPLPKDGQPTTKPDQLLVEKFHAVAIEAFHKSVQMPRLQTLDRLVDAKLQPGFFFAYGPDGFGDEEDISRVYWNLRNVDASTYLLQETISKLYPAGESFQIKVSTCHAGYERADVAVLYIPTKRLPVVLQALLKPYKRLMAGGMLGLQAPTWTHVLAPGVSVADDLGGHRSFGEQRCDEVADAIVRAVDFVDGAIDERAVRTRLGEVGIDVTRPDRDSTRSSKTHIPPQIEQHYKSVHASSPQKSAARAKEYKAPIEVVAQSVAWLVENAIWDGRSCSWMIAMNTPNLDVVMKSADETIYSGTAGVAIALALAFAVDESLSTRELAIGAATCALDQIETSPWKEGFFVGTSGALASCCLVATLCQDDTLFHRAVSLVQLGCSEDVHCDDVDVVSGLAGTILGLDAIPTVKAKSMLLERTNLLLSASVSVGEYRVWGLAQPNQVPLTGFAHGATGIACALSVAARLDASFRSFALKAVAYEDTWFSSSAKNWPDLRGVDDTSKVSDETRTYAYAWCHGAPGIAVGRELAGLPLPSATLRPQFVRISDCSVPDYGTPADLRNAVCLCHGTLGLLDIGLPKKLNSNDASPARHLARAAQQLIRFDSDPSLLLGVAGLLHTGARILMPGLPSALRCLQAP